MEVKKEAVLVEETPETVKTEKTKKTKIKKEKGKKKTIRNIIIILLVIAVLVAAFFIFVKKKQEAATVVISASPVTRGNITVNISGSGMIEALESYDVVAMVQGDVLTAPFEEGQIVNEDDILYTFDSEDAQQSLRTQQNNYDSQRISYETEQKKWERFTVEAPVSGYVRDIPSDLRVGDELPNGTRIATINSAKTNRAKKIDIPKEQLEELIEQGKTQEEIARAFGCSVDTIQRREKEYCLGKYKKNKVNF